MQFLMNKNLVINSLLFFVCTFFIAANDADDSEILQSVSVRKIENGKLIAIDSILIQINTRKGETASEFSLQYSKKDKTNVESAWIEDVFGNIIRKLENKDILTSNLISNSSLYQDEFLKEFQLKHNVYPYRIFLCYKTVYNDFMFICNWQPVQNIWKSNDLSSQTVKSAKLTVEVPKNYEIKYNSKNIEQPQIENQKEKIVYSWQTAYQGQKEENLAPYSALKIPEVTVLPLNFKYGVKGSFESWESFGEWHKELNKNLLFLPEYEKRKIDQMLNGINEKRRKIEILYKYLQNSTRYVNVKINTGGFKSYPAEYVANNKYGDCKALSTFMIALLQHAKIPANYVLIQAGSNIDEYDFSFPSQIFNHVMVAVPMENDTIFLECTEKNIPLGYMGTFTQNRNALIISDKSHLIHIPALTEKDVECSMRTETDWLGDLNPTKINMTQRGYAYSLYSYIANNLNKSNVERYLRNVFQSAFQIGDYKIEKGDENFPQINISVMLLMNRVKEIYGKDVFVNPFARSFPDLELPADRTQSVQMDYPFCYSDTNIYVLPDNHLYLLQNTNKLENSFKIEKTTKYGKYVYSYSLSDNFLTVIKHRTIFSGKYELDEYADFYEFIKDLKKYENQQIHLKQ